MILADIRKIEIVNEANSYTEEVRRSIKEKYGFKKDDAVIFKIGEITALKDLINKD